MLKKIILVAALSTSASCWAASSGNQTKPPSTDSDQQTQTLQTDSSATMVNTQSAPHAKANKKSPMVEFCKKHTC